MCRCRVMTIFYEHKTFFVSNFETTVHAISLNIVWSKLSEIVRWLYSVRVCDASWGEWRVNALYSRVLLGRQKGTCKSRTGRRHWYTSPGTKWGQQVCCRCSVGSLLLLRNTAISVSVQCMSVRSRMSKHMPSSSSTSPLVIIKKLTYAIYNKNIVKAKIQKYSESHARTVVRECIRTTMKVNGRGGNLTPAIQKRLHRWSPKFV